MFTCHDWKPTGTHRAHRALIAQHRGLATNESLVLLTLDGQIFQAEPERIAQGLAGLERSVILVGLFSHPQLRAREYVPWLNDPAYATHELFVIDQLLPWIESNFNLKLSANNLGICGFSNGAIAALSMGLKHRHRYGLIAAMSLVDSHQRYCDELLVLEPRPAIYLAAGAREKPICRKSHQFWQRMCLLGINCCFSTREGVGHETRLWASEIGNILRWWK